MAVEDHRPRTAPVTMRVWARRISQDFGNDRVGWVELELAADWHRHQWLLFVRFDL